VKINDLRRLNRRELTRRLLTFNLAVTTVLIMAATQAEAAGTAPNGSKRNVKLHDRTVAPALGQGSSRLGQGRHSESAEAEALREGISLGMTLIDTAEIYGNGVAERLIGLTVLAMSRCVVD
jgi:Aldo/keto reductase family